MEKLEIKGNIIIWTAGNKRWLINFTELTQAYLSGKHGYTGRELSTATQNKMLIIIKKIAGTWWTKLLKKIKSYQQISTTQLQKLKGLAAKLGSGKYATVYLYKDYAVKIIGHKFYSNLPRIDGKLEARILELLKTKIVYSYSSPNIIIMYQYTQGSKNDFIVLEKLDQTFWSYLQGSPNDRIVKGIILQVLFTLTILQHEIPGFRHNDLKTDNILLDKTLRSQPLTLRYKKFFWTLPSDIPLVKIADFDYACAPSLCDNPKVGTSYSCSFGCTDSPSKIYDQHIFLNSIYTHRDKLGPALTNWLKRRLPPKTRGNENTDVKFGRLKNPEEWEHSMYSPLKILTSQFYVDFKTNHPTYPMWGVKS